MNESLERDVEIGIVQHTIGFLPTHPSCTRARRLHAGIGNAHAGLGEPVKVTAETSCG